MRETATSAFGSTWLVLALGLVAIAVAGSALARVVRAARPGKLVGAHVLGAFVACAVAALGTAGTVHRTRRAVDVGSESMGPVAREQARRAGHRVSLVDAALGTATGAVGLGFAIAAALSLLARRTELGRIVPDALRSGPDRTGQEPRSEARASSSLEADPNELSDEQSDSSFALGSLVLGGFATFGLAASAMPLLLPLPGRDLPDADPGWGLVEAEHELSEGNASLGCAKLWDALSSGANAERARVGNVDGMKRECVEQRLEWSLGGADPIEAKPALDALLAEGIDLEPALRTRVEQARDALDRSMAR
jgi:hypothetical protein